jgi:hypothetical protein
VAEARALVVDARSLEDVRRVRSGGRTRHRKPRPAS